MTAERDPLADVDVQSATADDVDPATLRAAVEHEHAQVRQRAIAVCEVIAADDLDDVAGYVPTLATLLADSNAAVSQRAAGLLVPVARNHPTVFADHVPEILALLDDDLGGHRLLGAQILAEVVLVDAEAVAPHFGAIVDALAATDLDVTADLPEEATVDTVALETIRRHEDDEHGWRVAARDTLSNVVVAVVESEPATVADDVDDVAALLDHDDEVIVANAIDALSAYAEYDPSIVDPYVGDLLGCLADDDVVVRARAIRALGFAGAEEAVVDLRTLAADDPDEDVRALADETVEFLEET